MRRAHAARRRSGLTPPASATILFFFAQRGPHAGPALPHGETREIALQLDTEAWTSAAGACNEDIHGHAGHAAWLLDGATSLSRRAVQAPCGRMITDAAHFVSLFSARFDKSLRLGQDLEQAIESALDWVRRDRLVAAWMTEGTDTPSASFCAVRLAGAELEVANLGDVSILLQADDGGITTFGSSAVRELDAQLLRQYLRLRVTLPDRAAVWAALVPLIRANRARMNQPGGYWILEPRGAGLPGLQRTRLPFARRVRGLLVSDGLFRLVDTYRLMSQDHLFITAFTPSGPQQLLKRLRDAEAGDPAAIRWPRVKLRDDATLVRFETR